MQKIRLGVVGVGNIFTATHLQPLLDHPEVELVALCDVDRGRAERLAEELGIGLVFSSYNEMLRRDDVDAVDICTSNRYHSEVAIAALRAGKHVFCEKPDAVNPEEAEKMADAARQSGKVLMTMRNNRFTPSAKFLKRYIEEGNMGELYTGRCGWVRRRGIPGKGGWFTTKALSGGGPLIDLGVHFIDLAMWLMGNPRPIAVTGATYAKFTNNNIADSTRSSSGDKTDDGIFDVEDLAIGFIRFDNGATLQIEFSWASNIEEEHNFVELRGTKAGFQLRKGDLNIYSEAAGQLLDIRPVFKERASSTHGEHLKHFVDVVLRRDEPIMLPEQGVDMIKILSVIYRSAETGREVIL